MNSVFLSENAAAIIGVVGTILGTVIGWLLNSFSQLGSLHFYIKSWKSYMFRPDNGSGSMLANSVDEVERYEFTAMVDIYNAGKSPKIMRNIEIAFFKGRKEIITFPQKDVLSRYAKEDEFDPINILPRTVKPKKFEYIVFSKRNEINDILKADRVFLTYNVRFRWKHKVLLHKENFSLYFENHKTEEDNNGYA